jgi:hypothetical protein
MAVVMERPKPTLPPNHKPPGGVPYRVQNGDNWVSIAQRLGMEPRSLIFFNFGTSEPKHVNYYLKHNVGCTTVSPDGKNYSFWNASPGIIYLPSSASNFHYISAPPADPVETFDFLRTKELQPEQHPLISDRIRCQAYFEVNIRFKRSVPDVTRYAYRQFVRGRVQLRSNASSTWWDQSPEVPVRVPGQPFTFGAVMPISPTVWMEDGKWENGVVQRYGYREAPPELIVPHDYYHDQIVTTRPATPGAVWQTGYAYRCTDRPGVGSVMKYIDGESINGISIKLEFRLEVWDVHSSSVLRTRTERIDGHFEITSRTPVMFNKINPPT